MRVCYIFPRFSISLNISFVFNNWIKQQPLLSSHRSVSPGQRQARLGISLKRVGLCRQYQPWKHNFTSQKRHILFGTKICPSIDIGSPQKQWHGQRQKQRQEQGQRQWQFWMMDATHLSHLTTSLQSPTVVRRKYSVGGLQIIFQQVLEYWRSANKSEVFVRVALLCIFPAKKFSYLPLQRSSTLSLKANSSASVSLWAEAREREKERRRRSMLGKSCFSAPACLTSACLTNLCLEYSPVAHRKCISGSWDRLESTFTTTYNMISIRASEDLKRGAAGKST